VTSVTSLLGAYKPFYSSNAGTKARRSSISLAPHQRSTVPAKNILVNGGYTTK
jgi:hypothetical protein